MRNAPKPIPTALSPLDRKTLRQSSGQNRAPGQWYAAKWNCHLKTTVLVDDPTANVCGKRVIVECETEEDARAIAATLELLEAARKAEAVLSRGGWLESSPDPEAVALRELRAAIAKATEVRHG